MYLGALSDQNLWHVFFKYSKTQKELSNWLIQDQFEVHLCGRGGDRSRGWCDREHVRQLGQRELSFLQEKPESERSRPKTSFAWCQPPLLLTNLIENFTWVWGKLGFIILISLHIRLIALVTSIKRKSHTAPSHPRPSRLKQNFYC